MFRAFMHVTCKLIPPYPDRELWAVAHLTLPAAAALADIVTHYEPHRTNGTVCSTNRVTMAVAIIASAGARPVAPRTQA